MRNEPYHSLDGKTGSPPERGLVAIARITRTRGLRGEVVAQVLTGYPDRFADVHEATVQLPTGERFRLRVERHWFHQQRLILQFAGIDTRERAQELVGGMVKVEEDELVELPEDEFFHFQLIDCQVKTTTGVPVGHVVRIMETAGSPLLVVQDAGGGEHLIPFVKSICQEVDVERKRIQIDPPEGLLDL